MKKLVSLFSVLFVLACAAGLWARGTTAGTVITNMTITNQTVTYSTATNAGNLSVIFANGSGVTNNGFVFGSKVRTTINQAYDLSSLPGLNNLLANTQFVSAGGTTPLAWVTVTNLGNAPANVHIMMSNGGATPFWSSSNSYVLYTNGVAATAPATVINFTYPSLPAGSVLTWGMTIKAPASMPDGSTNVWYVRQADDAGFPGGYKTGDVWPGVEALAPSVSDISNFRDYQLSPRFFVVVRGPIVRLLKSVDYNARLPYQRMNYSIVVTNDGTANALNLRIRDVIPANTVLLTNTLRWWTNYSATSNTLTANAGDADGGAVLGATRDKVLFTLPVLGAKKSAKLRFEVQVK